MTGPTPEPDWLSPPGPQITKKKDGPMLTTRDGSCHYLKWWERLLLGLHFITIEDLELKYQSRNSTCRTRN